MGKKPKLFIIVLRLSLGWFFLYQGIAALTKPGWTLLPRLENAKTFTEFYAILVSPAVLPYVTYLIQGIFLVAGALLIIGLFSRFAAVLGIAVTALFYMARLEFPYIDGNYLINEQAIVIVALCFMIVSHAGDYFGMGSLFKFSRY